MDNVIATGALRCRATLTNKGDRVRLIDPEDADARDRKAMVTDVEARHASASPDAAARQALLTAGPALKQAVRSEQLWNRTLAESLWLFKAKHPHLLKPETTAAWASKFKELREWWADNNGGGGGGAQSQPQRQLAAALLDQTRGYSLGTDAAAAEPPLLAASELIASCDEAADLRLPDGRSLVEAAAEAASSEGSFIAEIPALLKTAKATLTVPGAMLHAAAKANTVVPAPAGASAAPLDAPTLAAFALELEAAAATINDSDGLVPLDSAIFSRNWEVAAQMFAAGGTTVTINADEPARMHDLKHRLALAIHGCADPAEFDQIMGHFGEHMVNEVIRASKLHAAADTSDHGQPIRPFADRIAVVGKFLDLLLLGDAEKFSQRAMPWFAKLDRNDRRRKKVVERCTAEIEAPLLAEVDRIAEQTLEGGEVMVQTLDGWARKQLGPHALLYFAADGLMHDTDPDDAEYRKGAAEMASKPASEGGWSREEKVLHDPAPGCLLELLSDADAAQVGYDAVLGQVLVVAKLENERYLRGPRKRPWRIISKLALRRNKRTAGGGKEELANKPEWAALFQTVRDVVRGQLLAKTAREGIALRAAVVEVAETQMDMVGHKDRTQRDGGTHGGWHDELLSWVAILLEDTVAVAAAATAAGPKHVNESQIVRYELLVQRAKMGGHKTFGEVRGVVELLAALGHAFEPQPILDADGLGRMIGQLKADFDASQAETEELRQREEELRRQEQELRRVAEEKLRLQLETCQRHEHELAELRQQLAEKRVPFSATQVFEAQPDEPRHGIEQPPAADRDLEPQGNYGFGPSEPKQVEVAGWSGSGSGVAIGFVDNTRQIFGGFETADPTVPRASCEKVKANATDMMAGKSTFMLRAPLKKVPRKESKAKADLDLDESWGFSIDL